MATHLPSSALALTSDSKYIVGMFQLRMVKTRLFGSHRLYLSKCRSSIAKGGSRANEVVKNTGMLSIQRTVVEALGKPAPVAIVKGAVRFG